MRQAFTDTSAPTSVVDAPGATAQQVITLPPLPEESLPLGRVAQLHTLRQQLLWCERAVAVAQQRASRAMRDPDLDEPERWQAVQQLRALAWKVCREVLPLTGRVPEGLRQHPAFRDVERASHELRRRTEDALADNAHHTADLVAAASGPSGRRW